MKVVVTMGTRPEIIRLYHTVKELYLSTIECASFFTSQNYEPNLSSDILDDPRFGEVFAGTRRFKIKGDSWLAQISPMTKMINNILAWEKPDKVLCLGDTNSALFTTLVAKKRGVPVYHMEAGNRCYDPNSPEEINRKLIDSIADVHLCYTEHARRNLLAEGVDANRIHVIGNPMAEFEELHDSPRYIKEEIDILFTCHRQENERYITNLIAALLEFQDWDAINITLCLHPRFIEYFKDTPFKVIPSTNFSDFVELQKHSDVIITDSGTVCEEANMLRKPVVIIRNTTERPELFEKGNVVLAGADNVNRLIDAIDFQIGAEDFEYELPDEYKYQSVSRRVVNILAGKGNYVIPS